MIESVAVVGGYVLGAIPFAYIITRLRAGIDIRTVDIGNSGAGSVLRAVGWREGLLTLVGDVGKGSVAILCAQLLEVGPHWVLAAGAVAVVGHVYPVYIGFRGGQGVATAIGVFLVLSPGATLLTLAVMGMVLLFSLRSRLSRRLFLAAACGAPFLPVFVYAIDRSVELALFAAAVVTFIAVRNVERLYHARSITERLLGEREESE